MECDAQTLKATHSTITTYIYMYYRYVYIENVTMVQNLLTFSLDVVYAFGVALHENLHNIKFMKTEKQC